MPTAPLVTRRTSRPSLMREQIWVNEGGGEKRCELDLITKDASHARSKNAVS